MRIGIVGVNYAPEITGIGPYTTGLAEGLSGRGHDVTVVTGLPHYPEWRVAKGYRRRARIPEVINGVTVERRNHYVPAKLTPFTRILFESSFALAAVRRPIADFDLVVVVSPSLLCSAAVVAKARFAGVPVGVIVHDLYGRAATEVHGFGGRAADAITGLEALVLKSASGVAVIHERFASTLQRVGVPNAKMTVLRNWTHVHLPDDLSPLDRSSARRRFGWGVDEIVVLHAGNMGVKQGLDNVVDAARVADERGLSGKIRFVLLGDGSQRDHLRQRGSGTDCLEFMTPLPAALFGDALAGADVLLVNEKPGVGDMAVPSKLTTYFATGRPVLAATDATSSTASEVLIAGAGVVIRAGSPQALLDTALSLASDPSTAENYGLSGKAYSRGVLDCSGAIAKYDKWCHATALSQAPLLNTLRVVPGTPASTRRRRMVAASGRKPA